ncbi:hypothetical protein SAMN04487904_104181 [Actinopolyspora lacussalsi subsp. righensis]|uniref:Uncharacterized protein n=1 Tax=Actinopolyspora righensis TaxID=995060 RepID=A0A1I6ZC36_9ACTN|nr:hypothetical protein SAMN04487904_104181 [Actinopolyspora righensis]
MTVDVEITSIAQQRRKVLRNKHAKHFEQWLEELKRDGCRALQYRLTGDLVERVCVRHLTGPLRVIVAFHNAEHATIVLNRSPRRQRPRHRRLPAPVLPGRDRNPVRADADETTLLRRRRAPTLGRRGDHRPGPAGPTSTTSTHKLIPRSGTSEEGLRSCCSCPSLAHACAGWPPTGNGCGQRMWNGVARRITVRRNRPPSLAGHCLPTISPKNASMTDTTQTNQPTTSCTGTYGWLTPAKGRAEAVLDERCAVPVAERQ